MLVTTPAIVLSSLKYGDSARIVKFYTASMGIKSFIAKGVYSKKNRQNSLFIPLNQVELIYDDKNKKPLEYFREAKQISHYRELHTSPFKMTMGLFLTEILNFVLQEEESNPALFDFLSHSLMDFDEKENAYSDFHLWFLLNLTKYLGFYPNLKKGSKYFDLQEGVSSDGIPTGNFIHQEDLILLEKLVDLNFSAQTENQFSKNQRNSILNTILKYYEAHILDFRHPKSLDILIHIFE
jgi:DNA repair protein RecO (recombination protein O)